MEVSRGSKWIEENMPSTESTSEGSMKTFLPSLIPYLLLPHRHIRAIITNVGISRRKRRAENYEW
jgi:hypothetical protein